MIELDLAATPWRKSSRSAQGGDACVEVAGAQGMIAVRDSKNPAGPVLAFAPPAFGVLVASIRTGCHDL